MPILLDNVKRRRAHRIQNEIFILTPPSLKALSWLLITLFASMLIYFFAADFSKKETVVGVLTSLHDPVAISVEQAGTLSEILVNDGDVVKKGTPLFRYENVVFTDNQKTHEDVETVAIEKLLSEARGQLQSVPAQYQAKSRHIENKASNIRDQLSAITSQTKTARERLLLAEAQLKKIQSIESGGYISSLEVNRQRDNTLSLRQQLDELSRLSLQNKTLLDGFIRELADLPLSMQEETIQRESQIHKLTQELHDLQQRARRVITAPVDGIVDNLQLKPGKKLTPGQTQMHLVPQKSELTLMLYAPAKSAIFMDRGAEVKIRFHNYPYQRFGIYQGVVQRVGQSVIMPGEDPKSTVKEPAYQIEVRLKSQKVTSYGKDFELRSGMTADVDVIIERRSLLYWAFEPVISMYKKM